MYRQIKKQERNWNCNLLGKYATIVQQRSISGLKKQPADTKSTSKPEDTIKVTGMKMWYENVKKRTK